MLGLAPAAAPLAAKGAADAQIAKLAGVVVEGASASQYAAPTGAGFPGPDEYNKTRIAASEYVKMVGVPDFVTEQIRRESQYVSYLDPDLAAKRSWSMSVKIATQRQRNFERRMELLQHSGWQARSSMAFKKLTGWDWPW
jgi:hypothetical protein